MSESRKLWTTTSLSIFYTTSLRSIPYYPLHSAKNNLYIPANKSEALIVVTHVTKFILYSMDKFLVTNNFIHNTTKCVTHSHLVVHFKLLCTCLPSNINYSAGLYIMHGNHKTQRQRNSHTRACAGCP